MNHGNGYSCGASFFDPVDPSAPSPPANFRSPYLTNSNGSNENSRYSPWDSILSGYSSTSSQGIASSSSSIISHSHGRSPDDCFSVDSFMSNLLQVVNDDNNGSSCDFKHTSTQNLGNPQYHNCTDPHCELCSPMPHTIPQHTSAIDRNISGGNSALDVSSPALINLSSPSPPMGVSVYCDMHGDTPKIYCQTCNKTICAECGTNNHCGHTTVQLVKAVKDAGVDANQIIKEAKLGISALKNDLHGVQAAAQSLEQKARQAVADVMICMRRIISAVDIRERELLACIEKVRLMKLAALRGRDEHLEKNIYRLSMTIDRLTKLLNSSAIDTNPLDLLRTKDIAFSEVYQIRQERQKLRLPEEDWISFTGREAKIVDEIARIGTVMVNNPGPIGDRRALKGRGSSPQSKHQQYRPRHYNYHHHSSQQYAMHTFSSSSHQNHHYQYQQLQLQQSQALSLGSVPGGRPIPSNSFSVIVNTGRNGLSSTPTTVCVIGNDSEISNNLCRPWGISCDREGHVIIADRSNNRIQIFKEDGTFIRRFGAHGTGPGQFDRPAGVAVDGRRRIIVADKDNHRIQILTMTGIYLHSFGEKGSKNGQFNYPWDVAVNTECQIVVSDTRNHRIQLFSPEGTFLRKYGFETTPSMWKHFDSPRGIAFNPEGCVVTTDFNNHHVLAIDLDFMNAKILGSDNDPGTKQFSRPQGLVIDDEGNIIVSDSRNHRIQVLDSTGKLRWIVGSFGTGPGEMDRPSGIALTPSGKIAVVDFGNNRVLIF